MFLGMPMHELANRVVELEDVLGQAAPQLVARLSEAASWEARFAILDDAIEARFARAPLPSPDAAWAWRRPERTSGRLRVADLATELGCSHRHLIARFREEVGLPPKKLARILRFNRALHLLERSDAYRLADVALDCGYYDQAHLVRDFGMFTGGSPSAYLDHRAPDEADADHALAGL